MFYFFLELGCHTSTYKKGDGFLACGISLQETFNFYDGENICKARGARLPEIYSTDEVDVVSTLTVNISMLNSV